MVVLRTQKTHDQYNKYKKDGFLNDGCNLCKVSAIKEFEHWKIIENLFPWDLISRTNHIIVPKRHVVYKDLNEAEKKELDMIKLDYVEKEYEIIAEATNKSIPAHFHKHLLILKDTI